jgi:RNA polymerase sigma-70 factor (ECF subfamily)
VRSFVLSTAKVNTAATRAESPRSDEGCLDLDRAMDRYADGDDGAFPALYDVVAPRLAAYVRRQVREPEVANDIIQQTFLHVHRGRSTFVRGAAALPWLFAIARRLIIDAARLRRAEPAQQPLDDETAAGKGPTAEEMVQLRETAGRVAAALDRLPPGQRRAFELVKGQGLSLKEAARLLGTTALAVKLRAHRAICALRSILERDPRP